MRRAFRERVLTWAGLGRACAVLLPLLLVGLPLLFWLGRRLFGS